MRSAIILFLAVAFFLGNYVKPSFISPDIRFSLLDLSVVLIIFTTLYRSPRNLIADIGRVFTFKPAWMFILAGLTSLLMAIPRYGWTATLAGSLYLFRWGAYAIVLPAALVPYVKKKEWGLLMWPGLIVVATGIFQYVFSPDIRHLAVSEWDPHYYRIVGTLLDPGFVGILYVFTLINIYLHEWKHIVLKWIAWFSAYLALGFTYSRSSFMAFLAAMTFIAYKKKSWKLGIGMWVLMIATIFLLPRTPDGEGVKLERTSSIRARLVNWQRSITIFMDHPVFGVGFNVYRYAQREYEFLDDDKWLKSHAGAGADSSLLFVGATTGIIGLVTYGFYLYRLWKIGNEELRSVVVALLVHSWFLNSLFYTFILAWLAILVAVHTKIRERTSQ